MTGGMPQRRRRRSFVGGVTARGGDTPSWSMVDQRQGRVTLTVDGAVVVYARPVDAERLGRHLLRAARIARRSRA